MCPRQHRICVRKPVQKGELWSGLVEELRHLRSDSSLLEPINADAFGRMSDVPDAVNDDARQLVARWLARRRPRK
jgi:hypothetical protein